MQFIYEYGLFLLKSATVVFAILLVIGGIARARHRQHSHTPGDIEIRHLSEEYKDLIDTMQINVLDEMEYKAFNKEEERREKAEYKAKKKALKQQLNAKKVAEKKQSDQQVSATLEDQPPAPESIEAKSPEAQSSDTKAPDNHVAEEDDKRKARMYVLSFNGDTEASAVHCLREEITAILSIAEKHDEVMLKLESPGGMVHSYGHASSQLQRLREFGLKLIISVDEVAASGGYMMACVGSEIIAAPFAVIGSIGVVAELPNFHRLMQRFDVDYEQHTAGQFKRTLTIFGENTDEGRAKFQQELEDTHALFKSFVAQCRPQLDMEKIATGEHWYGSQALDLGLVDKLQTSDAFLQQNYENYDVFSVSYEFRKTWADRFAFAAQMTVDKIFMRFLQRSTSPRNFVH